MRLDSAKDCFQRSIAIMLSFLLLVGPLFSQQSGSATGEPAGKVNALLPNATRNSASLNQSDAIAWNDLLKTDPTGRVRVNLIDGSLLSLGSSSQLTVVKHDPATQQTSLEILYGRLRSQVVRLLKPGAKFEVNTPQATAGVIGTDFILIVDANTTMVIVLEGVVLVTPHAPGAAATSQDQARSVQLHAGQTVEVGISAIGAPYATPASLLKESILQTSISKTELTKAAQIAHHSHLVRNVLIGVAAAAGVAGGVVAATRGGGNSSSIPPR